MLEHKCATTEVYLAGSLISNPVVQTSGTFPNENEVARNHLLSLPSNENATVTSHLFLIKKKKSLTVT